MVAKNLRGNWRGKVMRPLHSLRVAAFTSTIVGTISPVAWAQHTTTASVAPTGPQTASSDATAPAAPSAPPANTVPEALVPPKLRKDVQPGYPASAQQQGIAASVLLEVDIDVEGRVQRASVAEPSTSPGLGFEDAALAAAKQLEFDPALENGKPILVTVAYRFRFVPKPPADPSLLAPVTI